MCPCLEGFNQTSDPYQCQGIEYSAKLIECHTFFSDIDECVSEEMNDCHVNSTCVNTIGNYSCTCDEGFFGSGFECQSKSLVTMYCTFHHYLWFV